MKASNWEKVEAVPTWARNEIQFQSQEIQHNFNVKRVEELENKFSCIWRFVSHVISQKNAKFLRKSKRRNKFITMADRSPAG